MSIIIIVVFPSPEPEKSCLLYYKGGGRAIESHNWDPTKTLSVHKKTFDRILGSSFTFKLFMALLH